MSCNTHLLHHIILDLIKCVPLPVLQKLKINGFCDVDLDHHILCSRLNLPVTMVSVADK